MPLRRGIYPGSFNPPTNAHLAIAEAALRQRDLDVVKLAISRMALAKESVTRPTFDHRVEVLEAVVEEYDWLDLVVTTDQLLVDIAFGYDCLIMGADKWLQIHDIRFYRDATARDAAIARLPDLAIAPRDGLDVPAPAVLDLEGHLGTVSSTAARAGATHLMCEPAQRFDMATGAWTDPHRYERLLAGDSSD